MFCSIGNTYIHKQTTKFDSPANAGLSVPSSFCIFLENKDKKDIGFQKKSMDNFVQNPTRTKIEITGYAKNLQLWEI